MRTEPHLNDDQLMETYFLSGENAHLWACHDCRARYDGLVHTLEQVHEDAVQEADAVFTLDRLHDQRDRVLRRLERQGHPAEVLRFPNRFGGQRAVQRLWDPARRWAAGAAAAGLVAGVFLGFAVDRRVSARPVVRGASLVTTADNRQMAAAQDEEMLTEIEDALTGPSRRVMELRALDAMTMPSELQEVSFVPR
jgi:hypothetical protein